MKIVNAAFAKVEGVKFKYPKRVRRQTKEIFKAALTIIEKETRNQNRGNSIVTLLKNKPNLFLVPQTSWFSVIFISIHSTSSEATQAWYNKSIHISFALHSSLRLKIIPARIP